VLLDNLSSADSGIRIFVLLCRAQSSLFHWRTGIIRSFLANNVLHSGVNKPFSKHSKIGVINYQK